MSEYRTLLERSARRFEPPEDALERLFRRRERKVRNQRIGAAVVALSLFSGVAVGLVSTLGERRPGLPEPITGEAVLEQTLIGAEQAPGRTEFVATLDRDRTLQVLIDPRLHSEAWARLSGLGALHARANEFRADSPYLSFRSAVVAFPDAEAAAQAFELIVGHFRLPERGVAIRGLADPSLGEEAVGLAGPLDYRRPETPGVAYLWRTGNVVLVAWSVGADLSASDVLELAREMDRRLPHGE